jgi:DNA-3-methyladenine glycosylase I
LRHKRTTFNGGGGASVALGELTIFKKRENYRLAFDGFNPDIIAHYKELKLQALMLNSGVIRNKLKIQSIVINAQAFLKLKNEGVSFSDYLWQFVGGNPIQNQITKGNFPLSSTPLSEALSKDLKKLGFKFVGSTICYAFMQAVGIVNDHTEVVVFY